MNSEKRTALEAAGWRFGDAADFLGMRREERQLLDARVEAAMAVRQQRESQKLSQEQLARLIKTSQPRIAKIERAASDVSLDQILRAFAAAGGRIAVRQVGQSGATKGTSVRSPIKRKKAEAAEERESTAVQIDLIRTESS